jgi:uncharacterized membrane protein
MRIFTLAVSIYTILKNFNLTLLLNWELPKALSAATIYLQGLYGKTMPVSNVGTFLTSSTMRKFSITCGEVTVVKKIRVLTVLA